MIIQDRGPSLLLITAQKCSEHCHVTVAEKQILVVCPSVSCIHKYFRYVECLDLKLELQVEAMPSPSLLLHCLKPSSSQQDYSRHSLASVPPSVVRNAASLEDLDICDNCIRPAGRRESVSSLWQLIPWAASTVLQLSR